MSQNVMQLAALVSGVSVLNQTATGVLPSPHPTVVHICGPRAIRVPSELWMLHKSESNAGKHFILSFMSILSSARGQWGGRGVEETIGFYFCYVCRGAEMKDRRKGSKQVNHCSCFKKKYLGFCLQGTGLWVLKECGKILKSGGTEATWEEQHTLTWKPWWHLLISHSLELFIFEAPASSPHALHGELKSDS